ncbi:MAG: hypothetical protein A3J75_06260 [Acidobacteria bacterium RBG_16_68_9]|nr:MAG: hypothetical protein A3J75_06260 [Acidobacteria bacterium RBG_16_68_9]
MVVQEQYASRHGRSGGERPERRLCATVLIDAVEQFRAGMRTPDRRDEQAFQEVVRWFGSKDTRSPFAFENVCELLELDPDYVRRRLYASVGEPRARRSRAKRSAPK